MDIDMADCFEAPGPPPPAPPPCDTDMLRARLTTGQALKAAVTAMKEVTDEATLSVRDTGLELKAVDAAQTSLWSLSLAAGAFEHFFCTRQTCYMDRLHHRPTFSVGLKTRHLDAALQFADDDGSITLRIASDRGAVLTLVAESADRLRCAEVNVHVLPLAALDYPYCVFQGVGDVNFLGCMAQVTMPSSVFHAHCRSLARFGNSVRVETPKVEAVDRKVAGGSVKLRVSGRHSTASTTYRHNIAALRVEDRTFIKADWPVVQSLPILLMRAFSKAQALSSSVRLGFTQSLPMTMEYDLGNGSHLKVYLASTDEDVAIANGARA